MPTQKIIYKGEVIDERTVNGNPAVFYNGKIIGDVLVDKPRTLQTENKVAKTNIVIGSAILDCEGKALTDDIKVIVELGVDPVLENNSWETISKIAKSGKASSIWSVGDLKTMVVTNGTNTSEIVMQIIGFNHDNVTNSSSYGRTKAGITLLSKRVEFLDYWGSKDSDSAGPTWKNSYARNELLMNQLLPFSDAKDYMVSVNKLAALSTSYNNTRTETVSDTLFFLSADEIFANPSDMTVDEGTQYEYFSAGNSTIKTLNPTIYPGDVPFGWWTRSMYSGHTHGMSRILVKPSGEQDWSSHYASNGVAFAFCL